MIWDGAPIQWCYAVQDFLAAGVASCLHLEPLAGYTPAVNLNERIGHYLKRVERRNRCCHERPTLPREVHPTVAGRCPKRHTLHARIRHAGYQL